VVVDFFFLRGVEVVWISSSVVVVEVRRLLVLGDEGEGLKSEGLSQVVRSPS